MPLLNKSILCNTRRNSNFNQSIKQEPPQRINPIAGIINTYQPQIGSQFFKDLAGNIKQVIKKNDDNIRHDNNKHNNNKGIE